MVEVKIQLPDILNEKVDSLVQTGWYLDRNEIFTAALRAFLRTHSRELMDKFALEDIEWGLRGN